MAYTWFWDRPCALVIWRKTTSWFWEKVTGMKYRSTSNNVKEYLMVMVYGA